MDYSKFNGLAPLPRDFNLPGTEAPRHAGLILQLFDGVLNAGTGLVQGAQQGRWSSLQEALVKNPALLRKFHDNFSQAALLSLYTLESEPEASFFAPRLMAWVQNHVEPSNLTLALSFYESWSTRDFDGLATLAQKRRDLILNRGGWLETAVYRVGKAAEAFGDPVTLAGFALSGGTYSAVRAFAMPRIFAAGARTPVLNFLATAAATVPEAVAFGGFMNLGRQFFYGQAGDWSWGYFRNLVTAFLTFKATGAVAASASQWAAKTEQVSELGFFGRTFLDLTKVVAPSLGTYGGIVLAHGTQEALGWKVVEAGAKLWFDSALFFVELRAGGLLSHRLFSGAYALGEAWSRRLPEPIAVQGFFATKEFDGEVAVTDVGVKISVPDSRDSEELFSKPSSSLFLPEKREWLLRLKQDLDPDPDRREALWTELQKKLTSKEAKVVSVLLGDSQVKTLRDLSQEMGIPISTLSQYLKNILEKFGGAKNSSKAFVPKLALKDKRAKVLAIRGALSPDPKEAEELWENFLARSTFKIARTISALLNHPEIESARSLADFLEVSLGTIEARMAHMFYQLEKFSRDPAGFIRDTPVDEKIDLFENKRAKILSLREGLNPDPKAREALWEAFKLRLPPYLIRILNGLWDHPEFKSATALTDYLEVDVDNFNTHLRDLFFQLEKFSQDPEKFIRLIPPNHRIPALPDKLARILALRQDLSADPAKREQLWDRFKKELTTPELKSLELVLEHPGMKTIKDLAEKVGISKTTLANHLPLITMKLEKFLALVKEIEK